MDLETAAFVAVYYIGRYHIKGLMYEINDSCK